MRDFSRVEVGAELWSIQLGRCRVCSIDSGGVFPVHCQSFTTGGTAVYTKDGRHTPTDEYPSLYFANPNIQPPPPPKVKKRLYVGVCAKPVFHGSFGAMYLSTHAYLNEEGARRGGYAVYPIDVEVDM